MDFSQSHLSCLFRVQNVQRCNNWSQEIRNHLHFHFSQELINLGSKKFWCRQPWFIFKEAQKGHNTFFSFNIMLSRFRSFLSRYLAWRVVVSTFFTYNGEKIETATEHTVLLRPCLLKYKFFFQVTKAAKDCKLVSKKKYKVTFTSFTRRQYILKQ